MHDTKLKLAELIAQVMTGYYGTKHRSELITRLQAIFNRVGKPEDN